LTPSSKPYEYITEGTAPDAPTLVILPGLGAGAWMFLEAACHFLPQFKLLLWNNPGVGGTSLPTHLKVEDIADSVVAVLNELDIKSFFLFGHSMGGFTAQTLAHRYPERVKRMVLMSTSYGQPQSQKDARRFLKDAMIEGVRFTLKGKESIKERLKKFVSPSFLNHKPEEFVAMVQKVEENYSGKDVVRAHFICGSLFTSVPWVREVQTPTLVIHGQDDILVTPEGGQALAQQLGQAYYWGIKQCGHFPFWENPRVYPRMKDFLLGEGVGEKVQQSPHIPTHSGVKNFLKDMIQKWTANKP